MSDAVLETSHPTREKLIAETLVMIEEMPYEDLSAGELLRRTGVSKGSLYHHFEDYSDLLEAAYLRRFFMHVETAVAAIEMAVNTAESKEEFVGYLRDLTRASQARSRAAHRFERARMLGKAERNERFHATLGAMQQRQTDAFTVAITAAQARGWVTRDVQARTLAVFIQAYSIGRIVDDITSVTMDDDDWNELIDRIVDLALAT